MTDTKYVGVQIYDKLQSNRHIQQVKAKALSVLVSLQRNFFHQVICRKCIEALLSHISFIAARFGVFWVRPNQFSPKYPEQSCTNNHKWRGVALIAGILRWSNIPLIITLYLDINIYFYTFLSLFQENFSFNSTAGGTIMEARTSPWLRVSKLSHGFR